MRPQINLVREIREEVEKMRIQQQNSIEEQKAAMAEFKKEFREEQERSAAEFRERQERAAAEFCERQERSAAEFRERQEQAAAKFREEQQRAIDDFRNEYRDRDNQRHAEIMEMRQEIKTTTKWIIGMAIATVLSAMAMGASVIFTTLSLTQR